jgi:hypothetical protein
MSLISLYMFRAPLCPSSGALYFYCIHSLRYRVPEICECQTGKRNVRVQEHQTKTAQPAHGTGGCECSKSRRLLMTGTRVPETCREV